MVVYDFTDDDSPQSIAFMNFKKSIPLSERYAFDARHSWVETALKQYNGHNLPAENQIGFETEEDALAFTLKFL